MKERMKRERKINGVTKKRIMNESMHQERKIKARNKKKERIMNESMQQERKYKRKDTKKMKNENGKNVVKIEVERQKM